MQRVPEHLNILLRQTTVNPKTVNINLPFLFLYEKSQPFFAVG
jgi:hypothetical protein